MPRPNPINVANDQFDDLFTALNEVIADYARDLDANETTRGVVEISDSTEAEAGTNDTTAMSPLKVFEAFQQFGLGVLEGTGTGNWLLESTDDLNTIRTSGFYSWINTSVPINAPSNYGSMIVWPDASGNAAQFSLDRDANTIYFRGESGGIWQAWQQVWHTGNDGPGSGLNADLLDDTELATIQADYLALTVALG